MADQTQDIVNALKGLSPEDQAAMQPETFANPAVAQTMKGLAGIATIPKHLIDAAAEAPPPGLRREDFTDIPGSAQPGDKLAGAAADTAMALAGTGAPAAEAGAAGIFGGKLAKGADLKALAEAERMRNNGLHPDDVFGDTGWFRGPADGKWRFEIPDNKSSLKYMPTSQGDTATGSVGGLMDHSALYKNYPQLALDPMSLTKDSGFPTGNGLYENANNMVHVIAPNEPIARSVGLHELQHGVQKIEGFSPGTNPSYYAYQIEQGLKKNPALMQGYDFDTIKDQAYDLYHKTAGEVEARNVQKRGDYSPQQRNDVPPWYTQDVGYNNQYHFDPVAQTVEALRNGPKVNFSQSNGIDFNK